MQGTNISEPYKATFFQAKLALIISCPNLMQTFSSVDNMPPVKFGALPYPSRTVTRSPQQFHKHQ